MRLLERDGHRIADLVEGLPVDVRAVCDTGTWVDWDTAMELFDRIGALVGEEGLADLSLRVNEDSSIKELHGVLAIGVRPSVVYNLFVRVLGPAISPVPRSRSEVLPDGRLRVTMHIPPERRGSSAFLTTVRAALVTLPRLLGLPDAEAESELTSHHLRLDLRVPESRSIWQRVKRTAQVVVGAQSVIDELVEQQSALRENYEALHLAYDELREGERRLLHAQKMEAVGRLAGGVAHDFNNLMTVVLGCSEELGAHLSDNADAARAVDEIQNAARRAALLTSHLLAFGRKQQVQVAVHDVNGVVIDLDRLLRRVIGGQIDFTLDLGTRCSVEIDRSQLEQVIVNLVINARDAMPDGGKLTIRTRHDKTSATPRVRIEVEDTGVGMPPDVAELVFDPFFTTKGDAGTGMGLSTVYGIVKQANGDIRLLTEVGSGSTFQVLLPWTEGATAESIRAPEEAPALEHGGTVLVIEDDHAVRRLLVRVLTSSGYEALAAEDREQAMAIAKEYDGEIALVICDVMLRGDRGPSVVTELQATRSCSSVLFISGFSKGDGDHHPDLPADAVLLRKPFTIDELLRAALDARDLAPDSAEATA